MDEIEKDVSRWFAVQWGIMVILKTKSSTSFWNAKCKSVLVLNYLFKNKASNNLTKQSFLFFGAFILKSDSDDIHFFYFQI